MFYEGGGERSIEGVKTCVKHSTREEYPPIIRVGTTHTQNGAKRLLFRADSAIANFK